MSVKVHEAYCLDAIQDRCDGFDHFWGDSLDARWNLTVTSGGTGAVVDGVDGGIYRLSTPTASDVAQIDWNNTRSLLVSKKVTIEARVRANGGVTDTSRRLLQLHNAFNELTMLYHITDSSSIVIYNRTAGGITSGASGITLDTAFHIYKIECFPTGEVHFYIDNVECANSPLTTNITTNYLQPAFRIETNADTDPATSMDIDYVWWRQDR